MIKATLQALALLSLLSFGSARAEEGFLTGFEDLPLMSGLTESTETLVSFDTPAGRFMEVYATGETHPADVHAFYSQTLPQLGWEPVGPSAFEREGEKLEVETTAADQGVSVRFTLSPI
ncbi:MAG: hypothetical protein A2516_09180 [Alphaproteobacteria bacterium RIFOXYD12_FULL_60_8]|nr:MAG: hypothetical protein A2516_09180 [Alphaproteobacteria bacterium RIFOXYD12_FULL_60_8]